MKILFLGDVCGERAAGALCRLLPKLKQETGADLVLVNAENACDENGTLPALCEELFFAGADVLTGGNHTLRNRPMRAYLDDHPRALRPENLRAPAAGSGHVIAEVFGVRVLVLNLLGTAFLSGAGSSPFACAEEILTREAGNYDLAVCDLHAEATAEKGAFARHFDGRIAAVAGTHTHVPTADLCILPRGTGFVTDLGMCGAAESVLGVCVEESVRRFVTGEPLNYRPARGNISVQGALFTALPGAGCVACERVFRTLSEDGAKC